jgi:DNA-binding CsgD family transcriptional regulator
MQRGLIDQAMADAHRAVAAKQHGWKMGLKGAYGLLAHAFTERNDLEAAALQLERGDRADDAGGLGRWVFLGARGHFERVRREPEATLASLEECGRLLARAGVQNPALVAWRLGAASAARQLDDREAARRLALEELRLARRFGAPGTVSLALVSAGLASGGDEGLALLEEAITTAATSQSPFVRARVLIEAGAGLRRAGRRRAALARLLEGRELAVQCGGHLLSRRAAEELAALGARPRRIAVHGREALTPRERQVAAMARTGRSNKEIADALFVTVKTVEWHLLHVFQKLHVSSREQLAAALAPSDGDGS